MKKILTVATLLLATSATSSFVSAASGFIGPVLVEQGAAPNVAGSPLGQSNGQQIIDITAKIDPMVVLSTDSGEKNFRFDGLNEPENRTVGISVGSNTAYQLAVTTSGQLISQSNPDLKAPLTVKLNGKATVAMGDQAVVFVEGVANKSILRRNDTRHHSR